MDINCYIMKNYLLTILMVFIFSPFAYAQIITGKWTGHLTQYPAILANDYYFEMVLNENYGEVTGHSYIYINENYGKFKLKGTLKDSILEFFELDIVDASIKEGYTWCIKEGKLNYSLKNGIAYLDGDWEGFSEIGSCNPGKIHLEMKTPDYKNPLAEIEHQTFIKDGVIQKVAGREAKKGSKIIVASKTLRLKISDNQYVDNDIISLYFNGDKILDSCNLKREPKIIEIQLDNQAPINFISFHALSLGDIPPNTASLVIDDGKKEQIARVESDMNRSDIIYLILEH